MDSLRNEERASATVEDLEMNIRCEQMDDLLLDGSVFSMEVAARHARTCDACLETLTSWNEMSEVAATLRTDWSNEMLWPRIERAIRAESQHTSKSRLWQVAAAMILTLSVGLTSWYAVRVASGEAKFDEEILRVAALDEVEKAEQAHVAAIERLQEVAEPVLENAATPLMVNYKEKLMMLDDAIAECEASIEQNKQNAHLRKQLLSMYSEKQNTLLDVLREETHGSKQ
jgi:hypothetical protein